MYCLMIDNLYFYRNKNGNSEIFTFNTPEIAQECIKLFMQYSIQRATAESGDPFMAMEVMQVCNNFKLLELPSEIKNTVSFESLLEEKGVRF